ncbi:hypothetical protein SADUNF_Sadunf12G0003600 [Salix dunnii]|uniref:Uncharacterized protein n=1 Tax=Salix dunnii TaxID=1413687 RepID=A0A835JIR0_9ROSI|nr:hypothetical protein SADUNF_Sadunf12G0003600 [Salix dunnii]
MLVEVILQMANDMQIVQASNCKNVEAQYVEMMVPLYSHGCEKKVKKTLISHLKETWNLSCPSKCSLNRDYDLQFTFQYNSHEMAKGKATFSNTKTNSYVPTLARINCHVLKALRERDKKGGRQELKMITVAIMAELLEEYAVALARITERLFQPRHNMNVFQGLRNLRLPSSSSATHDQGSCSFIVYF